MPVCAAPRSLRRRPERSRANGVIALSFRTVSTQCCVPERRKAGRPVDVIGRPCHAHEPSGRGAGPLTRGWRTAGLDLHCAVAFRERRLDSNLCDRERTRESIAAAPLSPSVPRSNVRARTSWMCTSARAKRKKSADSPSLAVRHLPDSSSSNSRRLYLFGQCARSSLPSASRMHIWHEVDLAPGPAGFDPARIVPKIQAGRTRRQSGLVQSGAVPGAALVSDFNRARAREWLGTSLCHRRRHR